MPQKQRTMAAKKVLQGKIYDMWFLGIIYYFAIHTNFSSRLSSLQLEMREQDHALARRLVELRRDIQQVKLQRSYQEHQDILEEAIDMVDGKDILFDGLPDAFSPTLKHCGVTKMNLSTRRFSVF